MGETFITILISSTTGIITYLVGHKRAKKELEGMTLDNIEKSLSIYQTIINDLKIEIKTLLSKVDDLENKIDEMKEENYELKKMVEKCGKTSKQKDTSN